MIHLDAEPARIGATYAALRADRRRPADAEALLARARPVARPGRPTAADARARCRARIRARAARPRDADASSACCRRSRRRCPPTRSTAWDMTILAYWAAPHLRSQAASSFCTRSDRARSATPGRRRSARASRTPTGPCWRSSATAASSTRWPSSAPPRSTGSSAKLLVVDDGGYGILREYQRDAFGQTTSVELPGNDLAAVAGGFGVPVRTATPDDLAEQLAWALAQPGPRRRRPARKARRRQPHRMSVPALPDLLPALGPHRRRCLCARAPAPGEIKARSGRRDMVRLNWNENLFGPLPGVLDEATAALPTRCGPTPRRPTTSSASRSPPGPAPTRPRWSPGTGSRR